MPHDNSFQEDVLAANWLTEKIDADRQYAQRFYAGLCNTVLHKKEAAAETYSCSWRMAGELISEVLGAGDYLDWYCSGSIPGATPEGTVAADVKADIEKLGWEISTDDDDVTSAH